MNISALQQILKPFFFGRHIENKNAVDSDRMSFFGELFQAESKDRIEIGEKHERDLGLRSNFPGHFQDAEQGSSCIEGALSGQLIYNSIGKRIRKGNAQFDNVD